jgi:hypothetical protein
MILVRNNITDLAAGHLAIDAFIFTLEDSWMPGFSRSYERRQKAYLKAVQRPISKPSSAMRNAMQFCACFSKNPKRRAAHHQDTANKLPLDFARIGSTPYNPNQ